MASIPFEYECDKSAGFVMDPNQHRRVGYVTSLDGFGLPVRLATDLRVTVPSNAGARTAFTDLQYRSGASMGSANVVGVIEKFSWNGGVGDAIKLEFYASQENASQIKALQQQAMKTTTIKQLGWWIGGYDQETKLWFEQSYPADGKVAGLLQGTHEPALDVDLNPVTVKDGIDVNVYKITLAVVPAANHAYSLQFANSSARKVVKTWGLAVASRLPPF